MFFKILFLLLLAASNCVLGDDLRFNLTTVRDNGTFFTFPEGEIVYSENESSEDDTFDRVYGGSEAALGEFPFMAAVYRLVGQRMYYVCGGSIISKRWVLTATHCLVNIPTKYLVVFGIVDKPYLGYDYLSEKVVGTSMIVTHAVLHAGYNSLTPKHDVGLLYTPRDIPFSDTVQPIRLAGRSYIYKSFSASEGHIYGWGKNNNASDGVQHLNYGRVTVITNDECRRSWNVDGGQICVKSSFAQDVCQGDSGGPLVIYEKDDEPLQIGIVSYGDGGCPGDHPSVFTRVSAYVGWIKTVTGIDFN